MEVTSIKAPVILMTIPSSNPRSISPMTPSPSRELRGVRLFRAISRKLGRRSVEDLSYTCEDDSRSSSTDSCSSNSASARSSRPKKSQNGSSCSSGGSGFRSTSPNHMSSSGSDTGSDTQNNKCPSRHRTHHSTTAASFRKIFKSLNITSSRSHSCSSKDTKKSSKKTTPKRILRPPVTYTYVRGLSGLPTQRIPRTPPKISNGLSSYGCASNVGYVSGLNR